MLGSNQTGLVVASGEGTTVVGGENPTLQQTAIPGQPAIAFGGSTAQGSTSWPTATVAAFASYIGQVAVTGTQAITPITPTTTAGKPTKTASSAAVGGKGSRAARGGAAVAVVAFARMMVEMV